MAARGKGQSRLEVYASTNGVVVIRQGIGALKSIVELNAEEVAWLLHSLIDLQKKAAQE